MFTYSLSPLTTLYYHFHPLKVAKIPVQSTGLSDTPVNWNTEVVLTLFIIEASSPQKKHGPLAFFVIRFHGYGQKVDRQENAVLTDFV